MERPGAALLGRVLLAIVQAGLFGIVCRNAPTAARRWCGDSWKSVDCHAPANRFYESNETALKVILASVGQTGTTSVMDALRVLGYRAYHADDYSVLAKATMFDDVSPKLWTTTVTRCRMEAMSLEPITDLLPLALQQSPNAKVILTFRDFSSWRRSTSSSGVNKDARWAFIMGYMTLSNRVTPWIELYDTLTRQFKHAREAGNPLSQPVSLITYMYKQVCNGYGWPVTNHWQRGVYKVQAQEEAYLAHFDEIRRLVPKERLLQIDVRRHGFTELERFLGLPPKMSGLQFPRPRSKINRSNDPLVVSHPITTGASFWLFNAMHAANYLLVGVMIKLPLFALCSWIAVCRRLESAPKDSTTNGLHIPPTAAAPALAQSPAPALAQPLAPAASKQASAAKKRFERALQQCPVVAILRGVEPQEALAVGAALADAGVTIVEVPLNSNDALSSIRTLVKGLPDHVVVGAGTVLTEEQVLAVSEAGASLVVSPNMAAPVIRRTKALGLVSLPGVYTPSEALEALGHGADALKAFPGEGLPPEVLKAWRVILPPGALLLPVGGVSKDNVAAYWAAGVSGFGVGSSLFRPGDTPSTVRAKAEAFLAACRAACPGVAAS